MSLYVDIKKSFGAFNLDMKFETGNEAMALLGASGCGKSITLKCISGIVKPDSGVIILDGITLFDSAKRINLPPQMRKTGFLFQNYALFPNMTVLQNIEAGVTHKVAKQQQKETIQKLIKSFYLDGLENHYPSQLSGGQQQRVALARILASSPKILMLDEPFSALDSYLRWQLEQEIVSMLKDFGGTTLFVSHNRDEVYRVCEKIAVVSNGKIDITSDKWELFHNPQTYSGCLLTGCKNISPATKGNSGEIIALNWGISLYAEKPVPNDLSFIGIRARELELAESLDEQNAFEFEILSEIQDTFTYIIMIAPKASTNSKPIRWEMNKADYAKVLQSSKIAKISAKNVLLLRK